MRYFTIILIGLIVWSCGNSDRPEKPDNLISKDKMSDIIYDVFLLNAAKGINKQILERNGVDPQEHIYKKHKIDSLQFAKSNDYYAYDTKTYEGIMQKVKQKIEGEKKKNDSLVVIEEKQKDSLTEIRNKNPKSDSIKLLNPKLKSKVLKTN